PAISWLVACARAAAGASRRSVLGEQGRRRLVDPQGRVRRGRRSARCREARIRGGARQSGAAGRMRESRRAQTAEPENHHRLRGARRLRSCKLAIEPLRAGMAAEERATAVLSRGRSRPMVHARRGEREDPVRPGAVYRPFARAACGPSSLTVVRPFTLACRAWTWHWRLRLRPGSSIFCHQRLNLWAGGESGTELKARESVPEMTAE